MDQLHQVSIEGFDDRDWEWSDTERKRRKKETKDGKVRKKVQWVEVIKVTFIKEAYRRDEAKYWADWTSVIEGGVRRVK